MRKYIIAITLFSLCVLAFGQTIKLDKTEANCQKVDGFGDKDIMAIGREFQVPLSSIRFIGAKWQPGRYYSITCVFIFDTAKGPLQCNPLELYSDDNGKTAWGTVSGNYTTCWQ